MGNGEFEKRIRNIGRNFIEKGVMTEDESFAVMDIMKNLVDEAKKELLNIPELYSYEEIQVPDAWGPWFKKWFGHCEYFNG